MGLGEFHLTSEMREELKKIKIYERIPFEFNRGWYEIIYDLGIKIVALCDQEKIQYPHIQQIKEKFGTLRFYYCWQQEVSDEIKQLVGSWVSNAVGASENTCESCGEPGRIMVRDGGIVESVCATHQRENSITPEEYKIQRELAERARRKCSICGINNVDIFFDGAELKPYCDEHKNDFITQDEYFENRFKTRTNDK